MIFKHFLSWFEGERVKEGECDSDSLLAIVTPPRVSGTRERERGAGSGERGAGSGERGAGSGERGAGSGERGAGLFVLVYLDCY